MANRSQAEKEKGNSAFKSADYPTAIGHYSAAIIADRTDPTLPLNRAAAYLKLGKNEDAERDCTSVLVLTKGKENVKAYFRRAQARLALDKISEAKSDLQEALRLEPGNDAVKAELKKMEGTRQKASRVTPSLASSPPHSTKTATTSSVKANIPYRRRVPITIVEGKGSTPAATLKAPPPSTGSVISEVSSRSLKDALNRGEPSSSTSKPSADFSTAGEKPGPSSSSNEPSNVFKETREVNGRKVRGGIFRHSSSKSGKEKEQEEKESVETRPTPSHLPPINLPTGDFPISANPSEASASIPLVSHPSSPPSSLSTNCLTFRNKWHGLHNTAERWNLLNQIHPLHLPKLFLISLEAPLLVSILQNFREVLKLNPKAKDPILQYMQNFPLVPRFQTVLLFLLDEEVKVFKDLVEELGGMEVVGKAWRL